MEEASIQLRVAELILIGLVVFIAVIISEAWMDQQRRLLSQTRLSLELQAQALTPRSVGGFANGA